MSESLKRVKKEVIELSLDAEVIEIKTAKSSAEAATEIGCNLEEIAKSIVLKSQTDKYYLFICSGIHRVCLLYTSPSPRDRLLSRMPSSA